MSQAISLSNSSTRHCVSQHYSRGCCYARTKSLHPRLSLSMTDSSLQQLPTNAHSHTISFLSVLVLVPSFLTHKYTPSGCIYVYTRTHTRTHIHIHILGLIHYEPNVCFVKDTERVLSHLEWYTLCSGYAVWGEKISC